MTGASTICRTAPPSDSVWDQVRHAAGVACQRSEAYLTGQYAFCFSNASARTVKMHLVDDGPGAGAGDAQDYFLTLPAGSDSVEVPMSSSFVTVTAGFFRPEEGAYEIFWERRRFSWQPGTKLVAKASHSVDANRFRADVWPGAPEAARPATRTSRAGTVSFDPARAAALPLMMLPHMAEVRQSPEAAASSPRPAPRGGGGYPCSREPSFAASRAWTASSAYLGPTLSADALMHLGVRAFSHGVDGWHAASIADVRADGALELEDGRGSTVSPADKACLVHLPPMWKGGGGSLTLDTKTSAADSLGVGGSRNLQGARDSIDVARLRRKSHDADASTTPGSSRSSSMQAGVASTQTLGEVFSSLSVESGGGPSLRSADFTLQSRGTSTQIGGVSMQSRGVSMATGGASTQTGGVSMQTGGVSMQTGGASMETGGGRSGGCGRSLHRAGQQIQLWSPRHEAWVDAEVLEVLADGSVVVQFGASKRTKSLCAEEQRSLIRTFSGSL